MSGLLDSDSERYDPDLYASLGDDARKAAREDAVTEAYEGEECACGEPLDANGMHPGGYGAWCGETPTACTCTLACIPAGITDDQFCREESSCAPIFDEISEAQRLIGFARFNNGKGKSGAVEVLLGKADAALERYRKRR